VTVLLIALGAAVGAPARYLTDRFVQSRHRKNFPWGTFTVNVVASFVLGMVAGALRVSGVGTGAELSALLGTGFCGALSTYSTFSYETLRLANQNAWLLVAANVAGSVITGLVAVAAGWYLGPVFT
jgi:CrcB protein